MERTNPEESYKQSGIYVIECKVNGRVYIGATVNLAMRFNYHKCELRLKRHPNKHLQSDYDKWGFENFSFRVLVLCSVSLLNYMEEKAFELYECNDRLLGYNFWSAGKKGRKANDELLLKFHFQGKNTDMSKSKSLKVIDTKTGKVFDSVGDASKVSKIPFRTLCRWLREGKNNKSSMKYYE